VGKISRAVQKGELVDLSSPFGEVVFVESITDTELLEYSKKLRNSETESLALERLAEGMILTVRNDGEFGQSEINRRLLSAVAKSERFCQNMPIMITENSYGLNLFNGDMGIVRFDKGRWFAYFSTADGSIRTLAVELLPHWQIAFAITIHKSQGSEYRRLAILLGDKDSALVTRELLYTAITRVKPRVFEQKVVTIQGGMSIVQSAIQRKVSRCSGIVARISSSIS